MISANEKYCELEKREGVSLVPLLFIRIAIYSAPLSITFDRLERLKTDGKIVIGDLLPLPILKPSKRNLSCRTDLSECT